MLKIDNLNFQSMKNFLTKVIVAGAITAVVLLSASCNHSKQYKIGVSQCSEDDWRRKMNAEINREIMMHPDAMVEIRSADDNSERQIADINYFLDNNFDIIVVSPNEADALTPSVERAYKRGVPVVVFDRSINGDSYTAFIGADNVGLGRQAAHYALNIIKGQSPKAIEIYGLAGATPAKGRHDGFTKTFTDGGGQIIATAYGDWILENARDAADSLLRIYPDVDIIYAHNDRMAIGASEAARALGRDGIKIIGIDAAPNIGVQAVVDSVIDATFIYPTEGQMVIQTALDILHGNDFNRITELPASSAVDRSNADILLIQNAELQKETANMEALKQQLDNYWESHSSQTALLYASIAIIVLMFGLIFMVLRAYWQRRRHQSLLEAQNQELKQQRDRQRELNERLQEATRAKLVFFTNVSHDLRTPLTLIAEPVARLAEAPNLTPKQKTLVKLADKNTRILHRLINQILDFRKYENEKLELNLSTIDLAAALREWVASFESFALKRKIKLRTDFPSESLLIKADPEKLERVVFNLLSNAFKFTPDNGEISVECHRAGDQAVISVKDNGQGISADDQVRIFERFYQVDRIHPGGSGIGLTLSKAFVELHGGSIKVESQIGEGSIFTVALPINVDENATAEIAPVDGNISTADIVAELDTIDSTTEFSNDKPRLLVIDDNHDIRHLLITQLGDTYNVITAADGPEGIKRAVKYVPDVIVCDVMMPGMDGLECCRRLKAEVITSHIPVLMLTACSLDEQRVEGYRSGADGYISKPFDSEVLRSRIEALIENRRRIKEIWTGTSSPKIDNSAGPTTDVDDLPRPDEIDNSFYRRFLEIFNAEMSNSELSVDDVASRLGLGRAQFYRKIKALTNFSPVELFKSMRLNQAKILLKTTDKTISEVAYETGFSTPAYFTRCYREAFGETPSATRTNLTS